MVRIKISLTKYVLNVSNTFLKNRTFKLTVFISKKKLKKKEMFNCLPFEFTESIPEILSLTMKLISTYILICLGDNVLNLVIS